MAAHAGAALLRLTAERTGLTRALSHVLDREGFSPDHDRGQVLTDTAVMMADGGATMRAIEVLRHQGDFLGAVASPATVCRTLGEIDTTSPQRIDAARAAVRAGVWTLIAARHGRIPPALVPTGDLGETIVLTGGGGQGLAVVRGVAHTVDTVGRERPDQHGDHLGGQLDVAGGALALPQAKTAPADTPASSRTAGVRRSRPPPTGWRSRSTSSRCAVPGSFSVLV